MSIAAQNNADERVVKCLKKYLSNSNNTVSGFNFSDMIIELLDVEDTWLGGTVVPYLTKIGFHEESEQSKELVNK